MCLVPRLCLLSPLSLAALVPWLCLVGVPVSRATVWEARWSLVEAGQSREWTMVVSASQERALLELGSALLARS